MKANKKAKQEIKMPSALQELMRENTNAAAQPEADREKSPAVVSRDGFDLSQLSIEDPLKEITRKTTRTESDQPIKVTISQGDLFYAEYPVVAGHFEQDGILFAEKYIDDNLNGLLSYHHQLGIYPGAIGSCEVFTNHHSIFKGAIIVGLGKPGNLTASELTKTVEQGVAKYLLSLWHHDSSKTQSTSNFIMTGVSSLVVGCGYAGLSIENSIKAIIQGVSNANIKVRNLKLKNTPLVEHLEFVELYEDKAISSLFSISKIEKEENNSFKIVKERKGIKTMLGHRQRILSDETEAWWNRISVSKQDNAGNKTIQELVFKTSTRSSREEEQNLLTTPALMEKLIKDISTSKDWTAGKAKSIFELLIPNDFKDQLKRHGNIIWVLDEYTATYPWELLQDSMNDTKPICITSGMVRQLSTPNYRRNIKSIIRNKVLVVADPDLEGFFTQLPGALAEGKKVKEKIENKLKDDGVEVTASFGETHTVILEKIFRDDYRIIHLSGHGVFNAEDPGKSGMIIGNNQFLSTREILQMSNVPELVFVNCCHLGKTDGTAEQLYQERYKLAANIGTQLINNGVRCVIAAGWAVDDRAAERFAEVFYDRLFSGETFGDAILKARIAVYNEHQHTNTWGAYQCYGDPFYKFDDKRNGKQSWEINYLIEQEAEVELVNLLRELEVGELASALYLEKLEEISAAVDKAEIRNPRITELEASILVELREYDRACIKFDRLLEMEDASFSFSVAEKYFNAQAKKITEDYKKTNERLEESIAGLDKLAENLKTLIRLSPTSERYNILGSTYKRKALLITDKDEKAAVYKKAALYYHKAHLLKPDLWYSLTNWLIIEGVLNLCERSQWKEEVICGEFDAQGQPITYKLPGLKEAKDKLRDLDRSTNLDMAKMNYWDMIAKINIRLCEYILNFTSASSEKGLEKILAELRALWEKAGTVGKRFAEVEHIEFIIDEAGVSKEYNPVTENLGVYLNKLKDGLMKFA
jgi:CHAT domain-containing protein